MDPAHPHRAANAFLHTLLLPGWLAFRAYWPLFLGIQILAALTVLAFFRVESFREWCGALARLQSEGGAPFAALATGLAGGILPELLKRLMPNRAVPPLPWPDVVHRTLLCALIGTTVYFFYQFQDAIWGTDIGVPTLLAKLITDQFFFAPLIAAPLVILGFLLHESDYNLQRTLAACTLTTYRHRVLPLWAMGLGYWPIMVLVIYTLPGALQFTLFILANTAWNLVMLIVASEQWRQLKG